MKLTKTQEKNAIKLLEYVECFIRCEGCRCDFGGFGIDDVTLAEEAALQGWKVDRNGNAKCKKCK